MATGAGRARVCDRAGAAVAHPAGHRLSGNSSVGEVDPSAGSDTPVTAVGRSWTGAVTAVLAATLAGLVPGRAAHAQARPPVDAQAQVDDGAALAAAAVSQEVADVTEQDLAKLAARLSDPSSPQELRDDAARRLISRRSPAARKIVADALVNLNVGGQLAAARALADEI